MADTLQKKSPTSLFWQIVLFTLPLIATGILQLLFNTADTLVVGQFGGDTPAERETALAAVGSCGALINLIVTLFMGLASGVSVVTAQSVGARDYARVERILSTAILFGAGAGVPVLAVGMLAARPMLVLMGTDEAVLAQAVPYMQAYFVGAPANMVYNYAAGALRSTGDTKRPLLFLSAAGVVNVVLNLILVIVCKLGALGVGVATAASQWVSCGLILIYLLKNRGYCHIHPRSLVLDKRVLRQVLYIGIPAGISSTLFSLSNVTVQSAINSFDKSFVAGNAAAANLEGYVYVVLNCISIAAMTYVGQCFGAQDKKMLKRVVVLCFALVVGIGVPLGLFAYGFGRPLLSLFAPGNDAAIAAGMLRMAILCPLYVLCGLMDFGGGALRGMNKSITATVITLLGACLSRVVWVYTVFAVVGTPFSLYISYPITWFLSFLAMAVFIGIEIKKLQFFKQTSHDM